MKTIFPTALAVLLICLTLSSTFAQQRADLEPGYYLVVGAYASNRENIAQNFVDILSRDGYNARYGFNAEKEMYFVYLSYHDNLKASLQKMNELRRGGRFSGAWVRVVPGDIKARAAEVSSTPRVAEAEPVVKAVSQERKTVSQAAPVMIASLDSIVVTDNPEVIQYPQMNLGNTEVFLSLFNAENNRIINGQVKVIIADNGKEIKEAKGNEYLYLPNPNSKTGQLNLVCDVFGYRRMEQSINYKLPLADTVKSYVERMGTTMVVKFDLVRYSKGDKGIMHKVFFYNDAAIMSPESKSDLDELLQLMQEKSQGRIRIHGHTNGNYKGKIILPGADNNLFSLASGINSFGSAKDLSRRRAESIKQYLVSNGIAADRIEVEAWGGKKPIYDKRSVNSKKNVRVEVEILSE